MKNAVVACLLALSCVTSLLAVDSPESAGAPGPVVPLPPFHVDEYSSYLGFALNAVLKADKVSTVKFSRVEANSLASRAGLIADDELVAIDGHPVVGLGLGDLQRLFARDWKAGDTLTWQFTISRGALFGKQRVITMRMKTKPAEPTDPTQKKAEPVGEK